MPHPAVHRIKLRNGLFLLGVLAVALSAMIFVAGNFYQSASGNLSGEEHVLWGRALPEPFGQILWTGIKPGLLVLTVCVAWQFYRLVKLRRQGPQPGVCSACGYDLRASLERCPECGATKPHAV